MENSKFNVVKALIDNQIAVTAVDTRDIVNKAIKVHGLSPVSADALARVLTVTAILSKQLKNKGDNLSVNLNGGGAVGAISTFADFFGNIKGTIANPVAENVYTEDNKLDTKSAIGCDGKITVMKSIAGNVPYVGTAKISTGEIACDFANYFLTSEQKACALTLGLSFKNAKCNASGGVFLEVLPNCCPELLDRVETTFYAMDEMSYQFVDSTARQVVERFFSRYENFAITDQSTVRYKCNCGLAKIKKVVRSLGRKQAFEIIDEMGQIEVQCHFCNKKYAFDKEQIQKIFDK